MYQKCPICSGSGLVPDKLGVSTGVPCDVCKGKKIISQLTGKPPKKEEGQTGKEFLKDHKDLIEEMKLRVENCPHKPDPTLIARLVREASDKFYSKFPDKFKK